MKDDANENIMNGMEEKNNGNSGYNGSGEDEASCVKENNDEAANIVFVPMSCQWKPEFIKAKEQELEKWNSIGIRYKKKMGMPNEVLFTKHP